MNQTPPSLKARNAQFIKIHDIRQCWKAWVVLCEILNDSERGPLPKERGFYNTLFDMTQPVPADPMFEEQRLLRFLASFQDRSKLRVCIHLHTRLIPSAELLSFLEPQRFDELIEGNNDKWNKAVMFCKRLPQPDLTVAYRESVLTD